jgi:hypothetical protein
MVGHLMRTVLTWLAVVFLFAAYLVADLFDRLWVLLTVSRANRRAADSLLPRPSDLRRDEIKPRRDRPDEGRHACRRPVESVTSFRPTYRAFGSR